MLKSIFSLSLLVLTFLFIACSSDDDMQPDQETTNLGDNEVVFDDDNMVCTPYSSNPSISAQGILSVIMNQCQNSGSKLDGYFKYGGRPVAGTYTIFGEAGVFPNIVGTGEGQFTMVFYGHGTEALYSTSGTVELTVNAADETKLDMIWTNVTMEGLETSVKFSGKLIGI